MAPRSWCSTLILAAVAAAQQPQVHAELQATFTLPGGAAMAAAFAPDGNTLATGGELGDLIVRDTATWQERWHAWPSDHWIGTLAYSPDGMQLACCGRHLTMHDAATGAVLWQIPNTGPRGFAWRGDGSRCAYSWGKEVRVRDAAGDRLLASYEFRYPVNTLCYRGDDLFAGDNAGRAWRIADGGATPILMHDLRENANDDVSFGDIGWVDGVLIESTYHHGVRRGGVQFAPPGTSHALAIAPDGRSFVVGGRDASVSLWTGGGRECREIGLPGPVSALALHPDGETLFASTTLGDSMLFARGKEPIRLPGHDGHISHVALSPDGSVVAMLGDHCVLQPVDGSPAHTLDGVTSIAAGRTGSEILVTTAGACRVVDGRTGNDIVAVRADTDHLSQTVLGPGPRVLCGLGSEFTDLATGERGTLDLPEDVHLWTNWRQTARAPDGTWAIATIGGIEGDLGSLVVTDANGTVRLADDHGLVTSIAFSPDGRWFVHDLCNLNLFGYGDRTPRLVVRDGHTLTVLRDIRRAIGCLHFLDPHRALVGDEHGIGVLDVETGEIVQRLPELGSQRGFRLSADTRTLLLNDGREARVYRLHHE